MCGILFSAHLFSVYSEHFFLFLCDRLFLGGRGLLLLIARLFLDRYRGSRSRPSLSSSSIRHNLHAPDGVEWAGTKLYRVTPT